MSAVDNGDPFERRVVERWLPYPPREFTGLGVDPVMLVVRLWHGDLVEVAARSLDRGLLVNRHRFGSASLEAGASRVTG